jgi:metallo-beta-lactamase family protein
MRAQVHTLGGFSAHAGQSELIEWAANFTPVPRLHLVHGEPEALETLADQLWKTHRMAADIPAPGASIRL